MSIIGQVSLVKNSMLRSNTLVSLMTLLMLSLTIAKAEAIKIVEIQGEATIERKGKSQKAFVNTPLFLGDLLSPKSDARVVVDCGEKRRVVPSGVPSGVRGICPQSRGTDPRGDTDIFLKLLDGTMVYQTEVLEGNPILRWPSLSNSNRYQVQLKFGESVLWEKIVEGLQVLYDGKPLQDKAFYELVVTPIDGNIERKYVLRIGKVDPFISEKVSQDVSRIKSEELSDEAQTLILVDYYQRIDNEGLLWQALEQLNEEVQEGNSSVALHRLLGDIYLRLGRSEEAKRQYLEVIKTAEDEQNWEEWVSAKEGLAHIAVLEANEAAVKSLLTEARKGYQLSGNQKRSDVVEDWLNKVASHGR